MPYINIKITREGGTTPEQKAELIKGATDLLVVGVKVAGITDSILPNNPSIRAKKIIRP